MIELYNDAKLNYQASEEGAEDLKELFNNYESKRNYEKILICADLGLWYGRRAGRKEFNNINDCIFKFCEDYNIFYFKNKNATLTLAAYHHDGVNIFKFYKIIKNKKYAIKYNDLFN